MVSTESFPAFGGLAVVASAEASALRAAVGAARVVIEDFDSACSRFRPDSELMAVNAGAGAPVGVGTTLLDATEAALAAAEATNGVVDPTVGGALLALGYDRDFDAVLSLSPDRPTPRVLARTVPGWRTVALDRDRGTIRLARGASLDLGASAKALAADRCAAGAHEATGVGVLVSLSGDIGIAGPAPEDGWVVRVADDHRAGPQAPGQTILVADGGLASSSTTTRRWSTTKGAVHHLIDPATGEPAEGPWRTVSVAAASCLAANVASTATIIGGLERLAWLRGLGLPARLVGHGGETAHVNGWPSEGDDLRPGPARGSVDPQPTDAAASVGAAA